MGGVPVGPGHPGGIVDGSRHGFDESLVVASESWQGNDEPSLQVSQTCSGMCQVSQDVCKRHGLGGKSHLIELPSGAGASYRVVQGVEVGQDSFDDGPNAGARVVELLGQQPFALTFAGLGEGPAAVVTELAPAQMSGGSSVKNGFVGDSERDVCACADARRVGVPEHTNRRASPAGSAVRGSRFASGHDGSGGPVDDDGRPV